MALQRVSGLWLKDGKQGKYMSGDARSAIPAGAKLLIFRNNRKQADSDPDYILNLAVDDDSDAAVATEARQNGKNNNAGGAHAAPVGDSTRGGMETDSSIPF